MLSNLKNNGDDDTSSGGDVIRINERGKQRKYKQVKG